MSGRSTLLRRGFNRSFMYSSYSIHGNLRPIVTGRHLHRWMKRYICGAVTQPGVVTAQGKTSKRPSSLLVRGPYRPLLSFSSFRRDPLSDSVAITGRHLHRQMKKAYLWGRHPARGRHTLREGYVRGRHPCSSEVSTDQVYIPHTAEVSAPCCLYSSQVYWSLQQSFHWRKLLHRWVCFNPILPLRPISMVSFIGGHTCLRSNVHQSSSRSLQHQWSLYMRPRYHLWCIPPF